MKAYGGCESKVTRIVDVDEMNMIGFTIQPFYLQEKTPPPPTIVENITSSPGALLEKLYVVFAMFKRA